MIEAIKELGEVKELYVKTTVVLLPSKNTKYDNVKQVIKKQLSSTGRAVIVSIGNNRIAHIDLSKKHSWKKGYPKDLQ